MRDNVRQSTTFRHIQQRQVNYVAKEQKRALISSGTWTFLLDILGLGTLSLWKKSVNSNVLSFNLKL